MLVITERYPNPLPEVKDFSHLSHKSDKELLEWMLEEVKNGSYLKSNGVPKSSFLYMLVQRQKDVLSVIEYLSRNIEQDIVLNKAFEVLREYEGYEKEHFPTCENFGCYNQVSFFNGGKGKKSIRKYCCNSCSVTHKNIISKYEIDEETGLPVSTVRSLRRKDTLENTIDPATGFTLENLRNKATSKGRLEVDEETGKTKASVYVQKEADRRKEEIDPETGLTLEELYSSRAHEANSTVGEDGLTNYQKIGIKISEFYQTEEGKEVKREQTRKQRSSLLKNSQNKNLNDDDEKKRYRIYKRRVRAVTEFNDLTILEDHEKRDTHHGNDEAYHLDHIYSVAHGFENDIPPYIIGNINNLQFIHWKENLNKGCDSWMTEEELFEKVLNENNSH